MRLPQRSWTFDDRGAFFAVGGPWSSRITMFKQLQPTRSSPRTPPRSKVVGPVEPLVISICRVHRFPASELSCQVSQTARGTGKDLSDEKHCVMPDIHCVTTNLEGSRAVELRFFPGTQRYMLGGTLVMAAFPHVFHDARRLA